MLSRIPASPTICCQQRLLGNILHGGLVAGLVSVVFYLVLDCQFSVILQLISVAFLGEATCDAKFSSLFTSYSPRIPFDLVLRNRFFWEKSFITSSPSTILLHETLYIGLKEPSTYRSRRFSRILAVNFPVLDLSSTPNSKRHIVIVNIDITVWVMFLVFWFLV